MIVDNPLAHGDMRARHEVARRGLVAEGALRLSPTVLQIVERIRNRYGMALEVVDASLQPVVPEAGGDLIRAVEASGPAREAVTAAMQASRSRTVDVADASFLIQPLRAGRGSRTAVGLLAFRQPAAGGQPGVGDQAERWVDFLRIAIEAELSTSEGLREERLQARRTAAALRFLSQIALMESESDLSGAVVQAAAIWFDLDARFYRRELDGEVVLRACLPGITDAERYSRLDPGIAGDPTLRRVTLQADVEGLGWALPDALVVPIAVQDSADWVLVLGGLLPPDAQMIFHVVGDALGAHFSRLAAVRRGAVRRRLEAIAAEPSRAPELIAIDLLRQVMKESGAASGAVTLFDAGGSRRLAAVGSPLHPDVPEGEMRVAGDRLAFPLFLGDDDRALLDLAAASGASFPPEALAGAREAVVVLRGVLLAVLRKQDVRDEALPGAGIDSDAAFVERITQEVERAKRFDLGLSMLLIDVEAQRLEARTLRDLMSTVRAELRGSDVLGVVGQGRIAALLVHTDVSGVGAVVARVRQRLQRHTHELPALRLGRAVLSSDCATTTDFLSQASRNVEAVAAA